MGISSKWTVLARQFLSYVGVGGVAFAVDFGVLFLLTSIVGLHYLLSATIAFLLGLVVNYLLCLAWVFNFRRMENWLHEFTMFGAIGLAGLVLNNLLLFFLTEFAGLYYLLSKIIAAAFILIFNFSLRRWLLFTPSPKQSTAP